MMGTLLVMKEQLKGIYAKYSFYITVGLRDLSCLEKINMKEKR